MTTLRTLAVAALLGCAAPALAQQDPAKQDPAQQAPGQGTGDFKKAGDELQQRLQQSLAELSELQQQIAAEKTPLSRTLSELEAELAAARLDLQDKSRLLDLRSQDLSNLRTSIKRGQDEQAYLGSAFAEYGRSFESTLHIAELQRYEAPLRTAQLAAENARLQPAEVFAAQVDFVVASIARLQDALGGARFDGKAVDGNGLVADGTFVLVGPIAVFRTKAGAVGTVEQRQPSLEPAVVAFPDPALAQAASRCIENGTGELPVDPTLGDAHKIAATQETLWEHILAGGPVMVPIGVLAGVTLLVVLYKWLWLSLVRRPSRRQLATLLEAIGEQDHEGARALVADMKGPMGRMLAAGVANLGESKELIEEVMFERLLTTRLRVNSLLPFIAIAAASAPLLGLLGTVTGIITTFKRITVFGSGDPGQLSGGISEALITTEYGLIVAIPALLLHALLTRKARRIVSQMETVAVSFANEVAKATQHGAPAAEVRQADPEQIRAQIKEVLGDLLGPMLEGDRHTRPQQAS
jgi:biopolymer transport protein ExbB